MKVSNPLTIIAIFSGLAEVLATVALIQLPLEMQKIFVYFVIAFPTLIVLLFFYVLYFKNTVLYAPDDYQDPNHYLVVNEIKKSINTEIEEVFSKLESATKPFSKSNIRELKTELESKISESLDISVLTSRELQIYQMVISGKKASEIAEDMLISLKTVQAHVANIKNKLEVSKLS